MLNKPKWVWRESEPAGIAKIKFLMTVLNAATDNSKFTDCSVIGVTSTLELFMRFITFAHTELEQQNMDSCCWLMQIWGKKFLAKLGQVMEKIAVLAELFIHDGATIMFNACSKVVMAALNMASDNNKGNNSRTSRFISQRITKVWPLRTSGQGPQRDELCGQRDHAQGGSERVAEFGSIVNNIW